MELKEVITPSSFRELKDDTQNRMAFLQTIIRLFTPLNFLNSIQVKLAKLELLNHFNELTILLYKEDAILCIRRINSLS